MTPNHDAQTPSLLPMLIAGLALITVSMVVVMIIV